MSFTTRRIRAAPAALRFPLRSLLSGMLGWTSLLVRVLKRKGERHEEEEQHAWRAKILKRSAVILVSILCALLLLAGIARALVALRVLTLDSFFSVAGSELPRDEHGFTNFLLLGEGDASHDGVDLTDTMIVASIDPRTKSAVLLSLPRDLYLLQTKQMGAGRINTLYRDYKAALRRQKGISASDASKEALMELKDEIGKLLGLQIHHVIKVDFIAFVQAVDAIGGVDVDVPYDIIDPEYPGPNYTYATFEIHRGLQHLDGETALKYARSRHTTSDFDRSARQQQLLQALGQTAKEEGIASSPARITSLLRILAEHVETTMSFGEIVGAAKLGKRLDPKNVLTIQLSDRNGLYGEVVQAGGFLYAPPREQFNNASVLLPVSIPEFPVTWKQIQTLVQLLVVRRSIALGHPRLVILNASGKRGLAGSLRDELTRYDFAVERTANASTGKQNDSWISAQSDADAALTQFFATLLHLEVRPLPSGLKPDEAGPITILLGKKYRYQPLQDLLPPNE